MPKKSIEVAGRQITLDARPDRLDLRDLPFRPLVESLPEVYPDDRDIAKLLPRYLKSGLVLDQGREGACTGFGLAVVVNFLLWERSERKLRGAQRVSTRMLYHLARFYDEWPGEEYEGSSCRGALKGWHRHGVCRETLWPYRDKKGAVKFIEPASGWAEDAVTRPLGVYYRVDRGSVVDLQAAIRQTGAVYVSANVHSGWNLASIRRTPRHATLPRIRQTDAPAGGHAFALVGYNETGFIVQNSWGPGWGAAGFAVLPYEDWVENGTDAWAIALGVPVACGVRGDAKGSALAARKHFLHTGGAAAPQVAGLPGWLGGARDPLENKAGAWDEETAYHHTLVTGNDGLIINRLPHVADARANTALVCHRRPLAWFRARPAREPWRLAVYAHGGLNDEKDSIDRIRVLGPCFLDNGIYPVFTTWKSGWLETLSSMAADGIKDIFGGAMPVRGLGDAMVEATDRALEVFVRNVLVRAMWWEMKENVSRAADAGNGIDTLAAHLAELHDDSNGKLEIHVVGHSAGSFVCGALLRELAALGRSVKSCTLYAPACDVRFALTHFRDAIHGNVLPRDRFRVYLLSDEQELDDAVGPYRKSLLYLVSRALERWHKTPLLGLAGVFDAACANDEYWHKAAVADVKEWQKFFWGSEVPSGFADAGTPVPGKGLDIVTTDQVNCGPRMIKSTHGSFDNNVRIVGDTLRFLLGGDLAKPVLDLDF